MQNFFLKVAAADEELQASTYFWDNALRRNAPSAAVQMTVSGVGFIRWRGRDWFAPAGHLMLFSNPEFSQYGFPPGAREAYRLLYVTLSDSFGVAFIRELRDRYGPVLRLAAPAEIEASLRSLIQDFHQARFPDRLEESQRVYAFLTEIARDQERLSSQEDPVEFCYHYILNSYRRPFNVKMLATLAGQSREHLTRRFRERYGVAPATLLRQMRLRTAREMLAVRPQPLDKVAQACGLRDGRTLKRLLEARN